MVVESEGNGRMCLTLPDTLITVMGIEKLLPTWRDLEVFLQLLPRSSTGERMNPYTSAWTGVTPGDGPQSFHLVLLDNGRTNVLAAEVGRSALHCIRCSACLNVCPVYERTGGHAYGSVYPGPIGAVLSPQLTGVEDNASLPYASSLCGACFDACPVRIDIPSLLVDLRRRHVEAVAERVARCRRPSRWRWPPRRGRWATPGAGGWPGRAGRLGRLLSRRRGRISSLPPPLSGWTAQPRPSGSTDRDVPRLVGAHPRRRWSAMSARDDVLARIRSANVTGRAVPVDVPRDYAATGPDAPGSTAVVDLLEDRLVDYKATVTRADDGGIAAAVGAALGEARRVVVPPGLDPGWVTTAEAVVDDGSLTAARPRPVRRCRHRPRRSRAL